jgi:hypothetical protein
MSLTHHFIEFNKCVIFILQGFGYRHVSRTVVKHRPQTIFVNDTEYDIFDTNKIMVCKDENVWLVIDTHQKIFSIVTSQKFCVLTSSLSAKCVENVDLTLFFKLYFSNMLMIKAGMESDVFDVQKCRSNLENILI